MIMVFQAIIVDIFGTNRSSHNILDIPKMIGLLLLYILSPKNGCLKCLELIILANIFDELLYFIHNGDLN